MSEAGQEVLSAKASSTARRSALVVTVAGVLSATLGLVVLVGWYTHTTTLIQVLPAFVPMQYNTALGFLLCGLGLVALVHGRTRLGVALGSVAGAIGLLTLIQYVFGVQLGIDQLFFEHYLTVQTSNPGRMAPNTALSFSLTAAALITAAGWKRVGQRFWIVGALGVLVLSFSSTAFFGYLTGAQTAYGWGQLTRMAVHTSAGFVALAAGVLTLAFRESLAWGAASESIPAAPTRERRKILAASVGIMTLVSMSVGLTVIRESYSTGLAVQRSRLSELVQSRVRMIEAVARFDERYSQEALPGGALAATLSQIVEALESSPGFGQTGEFTLARLEGDAVVFIVTPPRGGPDFVERVGLGSERAELMQRALDGESGTLIGLDYRGERVVAAYEPVPSLDLGIVAKMDLAEFRAPFMRSAMLTLAIALVLIAIGAGATLVSIDPLARRVETQAAKLHMANIELTHEAAAREESVRALQEREALLEAIYHTNPDLQFILEADGTIVRYSAPRESDLYVSPETFLGKRMRDVLSADVGRQWEDALRQAREQEDMQLFEYSLPMSGEDRDYEARLDIMPDGRFIAIVRDITERRRAEEDVRQLNILLERRVAERTEELIEANRELESFAYSVSHDLKAPLRAIDGYSAMLQEQHSPSLPEDGQRLVRVVRENAQQMARLIDDVLAISRIARADMVRSEVDMGQLAQAVFSDLVREEADRTVEFSVGELPTVLGDVALLRQVWANLLGNSLKFTGGREVARIEVDCEEEPEHWVFSVRDNGAGFDMDYVDKLFGVFQRLHYAEEFPGTGVGLATVQRIIKRHGGEVWAEGEVDVGATIFFRLPRTLEPA